MSHMGLYFETARYPEWFETLKERVFSASIMTAHAVEMAKQEVAAESQILFERTNESEQIVRFVTENRITDLAMGVPAEIQNIQLDDVVQLWRNALREDRVFVFQFEKIEDIKSSYQKIIKKNALNIPPQRGNIQKNTVDDILFLTKEPKCKLEVYVQLPLLYGVRETIINAFAEYYFQALFSSKSNIHLYLREKNFSKFERYLVFSFPCVNVSKISSIVKQVKKCLSGCYGFPFFRSENEAFRTAIKKAVEMEEMLDWLNKYENRIVFGKPIIEQTDLDRIDYCEEDIASAFSFFLNQCFKIVVANPEYR